MLARGIRLAPEEYEGQGAEQGEGEPTELRSSRALAQQQGAQEQHPGGLRHPHQRGIGHRRVAERPVERQAEDGHEGDAGGQQHHPLPPRVARRLRACQDRVGDVEEPGDHEAQPGQREGVDLPQDDLDQDGVRRPEQDDEQEGDGGGARGRPHRASLYAWPPFMMR